MSKHILDKYKQWANTNCDGMSNVLAAREVGLDPWEVFKLAYTNNLIEEKTQEKTDEERRSEELSTTNNSSSIGTRAKSSRKGK